MIDALLIYPKLGSMDSMVVDLPLSIIYAATDSVKQGYHIELLDVRTISGNWKEVLKSKLEEGVLLAGISVMSGNPLKNAKEISIFIKDNSPDTQIVWGGPHVTVVPETLSEPYLDFIIRGYGSNSLAKLIACLKNGYNSNLSSIPGLGYKKKGEIFQNARVTEHEMIGYKDIPYDLIDVNSKYYQRRYNKTRMFPLFSAIGCPYQCTFCVHPTIYKEINGAKWRKYSTDEVVSHIEYVHKKFNVDHIVFMDDTSFPDLLHMQKIFEMVIERDLHITMEFRGARVNEIDRMDDDYLTLMEKVGGRVLMVGVESGSNRILKDFQKGITKEQILRINRKLARHPNLIPHYNFIYGTPGETYQDLMETKYLALQLIKENPKAYFGFGSDWKPIPGTVMLSIAEKEYGYKKPLTLDEWVLMDSSDALHKIVHPWYTKELNNMIKLLQIASFVIDDKIIKESMDNNTLLFCIFRLMAQIYKPIALFRLRYNITNYLFEYRLWQYIIIFLPKFNLLMNTHEE